MLTVMGTITSERVSAQQRAAAGRAQLTPLERTILATDGTLSVLIEAYSGDTLSIRRVDEAPLADDVCAALDLAPGEGVLLRAVVISGAQLGAVLHAVSAIAVDRLGAEVREALLGTDVPIGKLLVARREETFRELLQIGVEREPVVARLLGALPSSQLLVRSYRIRQGGRPLIAITERFRRERFLERAEAPLLH